MGELTVKMFGDPKISADGREVTFSYRKASALLYYLILRKKATRNELAGLLWTDSDPTAALRNLRHAIFSIRKGLGFDIFFPGQWTMLELDPAVEIHCDAIDFLSGGDLSAYTGEFLAGFSVQSTSLFDEWLTEQRNLFHVQYLKRLLAAAKDASAQGDLPRAEQMALRYLQLDPMDEGVAVLLMKLYSSQKMFRKAIGVYHDLCKILTDDLSISPLKETTALYYRIVNEWNATTYRIDEQPYHLLIGKEPALRNLLTMCSGPLTERRAPCALIQGEAGVGKTYLLEYILNYYDFSDWMVCRSSCYQTESGVPFSPWNSIMMTLVSDAESRGIELPENYLKTAAALFPCLSAGAEWDYADADQHFPVQQNFHAAQESALFILSKVVRQFPLLLVFEDIHWIDPQSLDMLALCLRRMRNLNITVICSTRDTCPEHVRKFLDQAKRDKILEHVSLHQFTRDETRQFISHYLEQESSPELVEQIYQQTGGNALLLVQIMNSLQHADGLSKVPHDLSNIIEYRLAHLPLEERQVLDLISVFPSRATFESLSSILDRDPLELIYICGQLKQRVLIRESSQDGVLYYALAHDNIRAAIVKKQSPSTRSILHRRVAQYLEAQPEHMHIMLYDRLIYHYTQAGDRFKALQYRVLSLNAYTGVMYYTLLPTLARETTDAQPSDYFRELEDELTALGPMAAGKQELDFLKATLLYAKCCYCIYVGAYTDGLEAFRRLLHLCDPERDWRMLATARLQLIYYGIQTWSPDIMREHVQAGKALLIGRELSQEYGIYQRMEGLYHSMMGNFPLARTLLHQSVDTFLRLEPDGDRYAIHIASAYNYLAETYRIEEDYDQAFYYYDQAIAYNRNRGYYPGAAVFYSNYGVAAYWKGERQVARQLFSYAVEIYQDSQKYSGRPIALGYLALYEAEDGDYCAAAEKLREAHEVSDAIGSPYWKGNAVYASWKIRQITERRGVRVPELERQWPADAREHCRWALSLLSGVNHSMRERAELEQTLAGME